MAGEGARQSEELGARIKRATPEEFDAQTAAEAPGAGVSADETRTNPPHDRPPSDIGHHGETSRETALVIRAAAQ